MRRIRDAVVPEGEPYAVLYTKGIDLQHHDDVVRYIIPQVACVLGTHTEARKRFSRLVDHVCRTSDKWPYEAVIETYTYTFAHTSGGLELRH